MLLLERCEPAYPAAPPQTGGNTKQVAQYGPVGHWVLRTSFHSCQSHMIQG